MLTLGKTTGDGQVTTTVPLDEVVCVRFGPGASPGFAARAALLNLPVWRCFSLECANGDYVDISATNDEDAATCRRERDGCRRHGWANNIIGQI